jgi:hypothetical protein
MEPETTTTALIKIEQVTRWVITLPDGARLEGLEKQDTWNGLTKFARTNPDGSESWVIAAMPSAIEQVFITLGWSTGQYMPVLCSTDLVRHLKRKIY